MRANLEGVTRGKGSAEEGSDGKLEEEGDNKGGSSCKEGGVGRNGIWCDSGPIERGGVGGGGDGLETVWGGGGHIPMLATPSFTPPERCI